MDALDFQIPAAPLLSTEPDQKERSRCGEPISPTSLRLCELYQGAFRITADWTFEGVRFLYSGLWGSLLASIIIAPHFGQDGRFVAIEAGLASRNPSMYFSLDEWNHRFTNASEMHHRGFQVIAGRALEGAHIIARGMGCNACEHHCGPALWTRWTGDCP
jgi:hypothetical protein